MQSKFWFPLLRDVQDTPVLCRCAVCGGEVYNDGSGFCCCPVRLCWFCRNRLHRHGTELLQ